jgi:hypothetical protein
MTRTRISPHPSPSDRRRRDQRLRAVVIARGIGLIVAAAFVVAGCASGGGGGSGGGSQANGISMYGTIDQGVSFRSR